MYPNVGSDPIQFVLDAAWADLTKNGQDDAVHRLRDHCSCGEWGSAMVLAIVMELDRAKRKAAEDGLWEKKTTRPLPQLEYAHALREVLKFRAPPVPDPPQRPPIRHLRASDMDRAIREQVFPKPIQGPKPIRAFA